MTYIRYLHPHRSKTGKAQLGTMAPLRSI